MSPQAVSPLALVAMLGGAAYVASGLVRWSTPDRAASYFLASDYLAVALMGLAFLLTLAGFVALHLRQQGSYRGPRGRTGFLAVVIGQGAMLVSAVASLAAGGRTLGFLYVLGILLLLLGLTLLSIATYKAEVLPHWSAYLVGALAAVVLGWIGAVVVGLAWILLGYLLWSRGDAPARQAPRVR